MTNLNIQIERKYSTLTLKDDLSIGITEPNPDPDEDPINTVINLEIQDIDTIITGLKLIKEAYKKNNELD
mgnify:CR=1 FL=1